MTRRNRAWSFAATALGVLAVFIFVAALVGAPEAHAYALPGTPSAGAPASQPAVTSSYDFGSSFNSLLTPFQNFIKSIQSLNQTSIGLHQGGYTPPVNTRLDVGAYFSELDAWVYAKTGLRPSQIFVVLLAALSWALGLIKQGVDWLLNLVHA